jgi:electron transfer flavoprotein-quinone oxidoreductase
VVLLADGVNSKLAATTGYRPEPKPEDVSLAVKEVISLPEEVINERFGLDPGQGITTEILGETTWGMTGVAFIYTNKTSLSVGIGAGLADFAKMKAKPYEMIEAFKQHPMVAPLIRGGKSREYLAHWLAEGGYSALPKLYGNGYLIAGDSAMLFNALHREGSNLAMASGKMAAETIIEAFDRGDFGTKSLGRYAERMEDSYILNDLRKYRRFPHFLNEHKEIFTTIPGLASMAAREMLTVDGTPKKEKQGAIWKGIKRKLPLLKMLRLAWDGWRSVR